MLALKNAFLGFICTIMVSCGTSRKLPFPISGTIISDTLLNAASTKPVITYDTIQLKYASRLGITPEAIVNGRLYYFIDKWLNTPYKWGGTDEKGIDCSAFLQRLLAEVYTVRVPRTSIQQFYAKQIEPFASRKYLTEGDLVFFRTADNRYISHVGLYLHNDLFVNASSSKGVSIASLNDPYWKRRYVAAGRVRELSKRDIGNYGNAKSIGQ